MIVFNYYSTLTVAFLKGFVVRVSYEHKTVPQSYFKGCRKCTNVAIFDVLFVGKRLQSLLNVTNCFQERLYREYLQQSVGAHDFDAVKF